MFDVVLSFAQMINETVFDGVNHYVPSSFFFFSLGVTTLCAELDF